MPTKTTRSFTFAVASVTLIAVVCGFAYVKNSTTGLPLKWLPGSIPMKIMVDNVTPLIDGLTRAASLQAAMQDPSRGWNHNLGDVQFTSQILSVTNGTDNNGVNEIFFSDTPYSMSWDSSTLAVTTAWYIGNQRVEADIIFNNAFTWDSYRGPRAPHGATVDLQRVALHELGHVLGLDHPDDAGQTVSAVMNSHVSDTDSLTADDIAGGQSLYGPPGVPANDNFALAIAITLTGSSISVTGFNTNATKEVAEPNHANNVGGRSVWWKWTAPSSGSTTITTAGSVFDTTLGIYTGSTVATLATVASNDDVQSGIIQSSSVTFTATSGTTYYIAVDGFFSASTGADSGAVTLNLTFAPAGTTTTTSTTTTTIPATTTTSSSSTTTSTTIPPTSSGGGGGGGAFEGWFSGALSLLCLLRWRLKKT